MDVVLVFRQSGPSKTDHFSKTSTLLGMIMLVGLFLYGPWLAGGRWWGFDQWVAAVGRCALLPINGIAIVGGDVTLHHWFLSFISPFFFFTKEVLLDFPVKRRTWGFKDLFIDDERRNNLDNFSRKDALGAWIYSSLSMFIIF